MRLNIFINVHLLVYHRIVKHSLTHIHGKRRWWNIVSLVAWNNICIYIYCSMYIKLGSQTLYLIHIVVFWVVTLCHVVGGYISEILAVLCFCLRYVRKQYGFPLCLCLLPNTVHMDSCRYSHYIMSLLLQRFVLTVHSRLLQSQHTNCQLCSDFQSIGLFLFLHITVFSHSGFGEGELAHNLLKGEESVQRLLAVSIPYVVRLVHI